MKALKIISAVAFLFLLSLSCNEKGTEPAEKKPPGYQEDIPWPSLADSPWPMNNADPQNTSRSKYVSIGAGIIEKEIRVNYMQSGVSLDKDSSFLFLTVDSIKAVYLNGNIKFSEELLIQGFVTPLLTADNKIYTASGTKPEVYAFDSNGNLKHIFKLENTVGAALLNIGIDGIIYCIDIDRNLYALDPSGNINWRMKINDIYPYSFGFSFSPDGKIIYIPGELSTLIAFNLQSKSVLWKFGTTTMSNVPVVDSYGNIYLLPKYKKNENAQLICLKPDGNIKWTYVFSFDGNPLFHSNSPTIDKNGNIYFAVDSLYSLDFDGNLQWRKELKGFSDSHLMTDVNSNIVVGTMGLNGFKISISCYTSEGNLKWEIIDLQDQIGGSPALGFGRIFYPSWRGNKLYIIK